MTSLGSSVVIKWQDGGIGPICGRCRPFTRFDADIDASGSQWRIKAARLSSAVFDNAARPRDRRPRSESAAARPPDRVRPWHPARRNPHAGNMTQNPTSPARQSRRCPFLPAFPRFHGDRRLREGMDLYRASWIGPVSRDCTHADSFRAVSRMPKLHHEQRWIAEAFCFPLALAINRG